MYIFWIHNLLDFWEDIHHDEYSMLLENLIRNQIEI